MDPVNKPTSPPDSLSVLLSRLILIGLCVYALHMFSDNQADVDLWGNVGFVSTLPWSSDYPLTNTYSFTDTDNPWINHEWGAEYLMNLAYRTGGTLALLVQKLALGFIMLFFMYRSVCRQTTSRAVLFFTLVLVISTMGYGFSTRPHHFTFALIAALLTILLHYPGSRWLWSIPVMLCLWANLHGAFFIGILLLFIMTAADWLQTPARLSPERLKQRVLLPVIIVASILATFINPYGLHLWDFIFDTATYARPYLNEWAPFSISEGLPDHADFLVLNIVALAALIASTRQRDIASVFILVATLIAAWSMKRNIPLFAMTCAFVIPVHLESALRGNERSLAARFPQKVILAALLIFTLGSGYAAFTKDKATPLRIEVDHTHYPVSVIQFLEEKEIQSNAIVFWDWAEMAIWHLNDNGTRVFIDGRLISAYTPETIEAYIQFIGGEPGWEQVLENYPVDLLLLHPGNDVYPLVAIHSEWLEVYHVPDHAVLLLKKDVHADLINKLRSGEWRIPDPPTIAHFP